jgi:hypothetical protein
MATKADSGDVGPPPPGSTEAFGANLMSWEYFYKEVFGIDFPLDKEVIFAGKGSMHLMLINNEIPIGQIIGKFKEFKVFRPDFIDNTSIVARPNSRWYIAFVQPSRSVTGSNGVTLREHLLRSLKFCFEKEFDKLDLATTTVCTGSPFVRGGVPHFGVYVDTIVVDRCDIFGDSNFCYFEVSCA